jgi:hypothetical protein
MQNGYILKYIDKYNQTEEICKLAVQQNINAKQYIQFDCSEYNSCDYILK